MTDYKAKNVGVALRRGTSRRKPVVDERDGSTAGHEIEHWDGSQDAVATPKTVQVKVKTTSEEG